MMRWHPIPQCRLEPPYSRFGTILLMSNLFTSDANQITKFMNYLTLFYSHYFTSVKVKYAVSQLIYTVSTFKLYFRVILFFGQKL